MVDTSEVGGGFHVSATTPRAQVQMNSEPDFESRRAFLGKLAAAGGIGGALLVAPARAKAKSVRTHEARKTAKRTVRILKGHKPPLSHTGGVGDYYLDTTTQQLYGPKRKSGWGKPFGLRGPTGVAGAAGAAGVAGTTTLAGDTPPTGADGRDGDFYIDTATAMLYGPKDGSWGSGTPLTGGTGVALGDLPTPVQHAVDRVYDVRDYGAKGDGKTDDSAAIQAAIAAAGTGGGTVSLTASSYLLGSPLTLSAPHVHLRGTGDSFWTAGGTTLMLTPGLNGAAVTVAADGCSLEGIAFVPLSGTSTASAVAIAGSASDNVNGTVLMAIYAHRVGGISLSYARTATLRNVVCEAWNGATGIELENCQIVYLHDCNSSAAGSGTADSWTYGYRIVGCETVVLNGCECNGNPYYGAFIDDTSDSKWGDLEVNGAALEQLHLQGGSDNQFTNLYIFQPAPTGAHFYDTNLLQLSGGWIGDASSVQVQLESCTNTQLAGVCIQTGSKSTGLHITDDGSSGSANIAVRDCNVNGDNGLAIGVLIDGSSGGEGFRFSGNDIHGAGTSGSLAYKLAFTYGLNGLQISQGIVRGVQTGAAFANTNFLNQPPQLAGITFGADVAMPLDFAGVAGYAPVVHDCVGVDIGYANEYSDDATLSIGDIAVGVVEGNSSSALTFTLPTEDQAPIAVGSICDILQLGTGQITIAAPAGVTLSAPGDQHTTASQFATITLRKRDKDFWVLSGGLSG